MRSVLPWIVVVASACGTSSDGGADDGTPGYDLQADAEAVGEVAEVDAADEPCIAPEVVIPETFGGERPAALHVPEDYDPCRPWPLIVLLHGYGVDGIVEDMYLGLSARTTEYGFVAVVPDGTPDADGYRFWNATPACCNFWNVDVDDVAYIRGLIAEAKSLLAIDPDRVYLVGHSNGGFMSFRMACDAADAITGIATLAGSTFADPERCKPSRPVSVLAIHGTKDTDVKYEGGVFGGSPYPGAEDTAEWWKTFDACVTGPIEGAPLDLEPYVAGAETTPRSWSDCTEGTTVVLWTMHDAVHIPAVEAVFTDALVEAVLAMKRAQ